MRTVRRICVAMLALLLMASPALAASLAVVTNQEADVHRSASSGSDAVTAPKGLELKLTGYEDGWGKVSYKGKTGYVRIKDLDLKKPVEVYLAKDAACYTEAGKNKLGTLSQGTKVYFVGIDGDYARVTDSSASLRGYVLLSALSSRQAGSSLLATEESARSSKIERVIYTAQKLLGKPYALVADPPSSFNCAAFVYYCFDAADDGCIGKTLGEQAFSAGYAKIRSISALKRGDIVCFNISENGDPGGHVGIYVGNGWFVHASTGNGGVAVNKLTSGYYKRSFCWGRRVFWE